VEYHANGGGGSWHANSYRRTSGQLSFEGSWILLLNNNSRELGHKAMMLSDVCLTS